MNATSIPAPPRSVRLRKDAASPKLLWAIFLGSLLISMLVATFVAHHFLVLFSGDQAEGVVTKTGVKTTRSWVDPSDASKAETNYVVSYSFHIDDQPLTGQASVGRFAYRSIKAGDPVTVRYWRPTNGLGSQPKFANRIDFLPLQSSLLLAVALVVTGGAFSQAWIAPRRERRLVAHGIAVPATITQRSKSDDKSPRHRLHFRYTVSAQQRQDRGVDETLEGSQEVSAELFDHHQEGSTVTALFLPVAPDRATIYETTRYEIGDSFASPRQDVT